MKIAVIGGGSTYTPELVDGFARLGSMVDELVLIDPAAERLEIVGAFAARIFNHHGHPGKEVQRERAGGSTLGQHNSGRRIEIEIGKQPRVVERGNGLAPHPNEAGNLTTQQSPDTISAGASRLSGPGRFQTTQPNYAG